MIRSSFTRFRVILLAGDIQATKLTAGLGTMGSDLLRRVANREEAILAALAEDCLLVVEQAYWLGMVWAQTDRMRERQKAGRLKILVLSSESPEPTSSVVLKKGEHAAAMESALGPNRDLIDEVIRLTVPVHALVEAVVRLSGAQQEAPQKSTPQVAVLHAGMDVIAGSVEMLPEDRVVFRCRRPPHVGTVGKVSIADMGSRTVKVTGVGRRKNTVDGAADGYEVELSFSTKSMKAMAAMKASLPRMAAVRQRRLLLIDDSDVLNRASEAALTQAGYYVKCITNPFETYGHIQKMGPDLVLVDYNMPQLRGDRLIGMTKRSGVTVPMVLYSSAPEVELQSAMERCGALCYIQKNNRPHMLVSKIDALFQQIGWHGGNAASAKR